MILKFISVIFGEHKVVLSIHRLSCDANGYCGTEDGYTVESWFGSNGQYVGGDIEDIDNEYVGAFAAEKDN